MSGYSFRGVDQVARPSGSAAEAALAQLESVKSSIAGGAKEEPAWKVALRAREARENEIRDKELAARDAKLKELLASRPSPGLEPGYYEQIAQLHAGGSKWNEPSQTETSGSPRKGSHHRRASVSNKGSAAAPAASVTTPTLSVPEGDGGAAANAGAKPPPSPRASFVPAARKPAEPADDAAPPAIPDDLSEFDDSDSEDEGRQPPPELSASGIALPKAMATVEVTNDVIRSHSARVAVGYAETQGTRRSMEDRMSVVGAFIDDTVDYFGLFDGHGGRDVADYVSEHLHARLYEKLRNAEAGTGGVDSLTDEAVLSSLATSFVELQTDIEESDPPMMGGSVAVVALMIGEQLYVANCGDARAVLGRASGSVTRLSKDHKPHDPEEKKRIEDEGGFVTQHTTSTGIVLSRVCGAIAVSRALGDVGLQPFLIADPHTTQQHLASPPGASGANDPGTVLILACDGLWDVLSDEEAVEIAAQHGDPERAATKLRNKAFSLGSSDNISVMVVQLPAFNPAPPESL